MCITETSLIHKEWSPDERSDDWSLDEGNNDKSHVGWHQDCEPLCCTIVSSFSLESSERVNANLDTGATINQFLMNFDRKGVGDGSFYDWVTGVEARRFQGTDARRASGNAEPASAPAPASEAVKNTCKEPQGSYVGYESGYMSLIHSKIGQGTRIQLEILLNKYGRSESFFLNFCLNREVKSEEIHSVKEAEQCLEKENQQSGNQCGRAHCS